jgi:glycosyltransferase involved in cell wall biosynthesis
MRILVTHPGADISVCDVFSGACEGLRALGHEVHEYALNKRIEADAFYLNYLWRRGKKQADKPNDAQILYKASEGIVTRALRLQPDVVVVVSAMYFHPDMFVLLRRAGIRVSILFTESPYMDDSQEVLVPWADVRWTHERTSTRRLKASYLPHAWHPGVHQPDITDAEAPTHDVVFVGTAFPERVELLKSVDWTGIDLGLYGEWSMLPSRSALRKAVRGNYTDNTQTAHLYRRAKVGLNLYRTSRDFGSGVHVPGGESLNPRAYELAATKCFTVSQFRPEVPEVFGEAVPTFETAAQLQAQLTYWLAHPEGRAEAARAARRAVERATWRHRAQQMVRDLADVGIGVTNTPEQTTAALVAAGG